MREILESIEAEYRRYKGLAEATFDPTLTGKRVSGPVFEMPRLKARDFRRIWAAKFIGTRLL